MLEALPMSTGEWKENCRQLPSCCWSPAWAKPTIGWLAVPKPQTATRQRRLFRKYFKFPAKENTALLEESAHDVALLLSAPRRNCREPGACNPYRHRQATHTPPPVLLQGSPIHTLTGEQSLQPKGANLG